MASSARIDELRKKFDENPRRYFAPLANEYRKAGDLEQAIFICQEYLPQQPGHMSGHIVYGQALFESGRHDEAKGVFETALALDPENLIALHHLGDIARLGGNAGDARTWYERVLEADPRNEEVAALLSSLPDDRSSQLDYIIPVAATADDSDPFAASESRSRGTTDGDALPFGNVEIQSTPADAGDARGDRIPMETQEAISDEQQFEESAASVATPLNEAPKSSANEELLDLDDFSLGGEAFATPASAAPNVTDESPRIPESAAVAELPAPEASNADSASVEFDIAHEEAVFDTDPFAIASSAPTPPVELASDLNIGLPDDGMPMTSDTVPLSDLETFEAGVLATAIPDVAPLETETFFDLPPVDARALEIPSPGLDASEEHPLDVPAEHSMLSFDETGAVGDSAPIDGGHDGLDVPAALVDAAEPEWTVPASAVTAPTIAEAPEAFVTETMAELYIQQGHLDSARDIYRKLSEQRPNDPEIRERLRAIEDHMFGRRADTEPKPAPLAEPATEHAQPANEPTIREFLTALLARRAAGIGRGSSNGGGTSSASSTEPPAPDQRMTPGASETITGSIDALFSGAKSSASDTNAANALADAFAAESSEPAPLHGTPAHRATDELSLDHVFKPNAPPRPSAEHDAFSFDQFFANELGESTPNASGEKPAGAPNATDDIAQFNAWLNGLKKT